MIIGTAGHIDHGKTSLVRALTGVDADRLKEEKARGITIDLGFAYMPAPDGTVVGFVDVPGHERLIRNMLAGATGIDFALLVVAADDGVMPQTREHLAILDLLGLRRGLVALTKTDLVDADGIAAARAGVANALLGTGLEDAAIVEVSSATGAGIDDLRARLVVAAETGAAPAADAPFRLAVDRSFTLQGAGTVVTGTVLAGSVAPGDHLVASPSGLAVRVRGLHAQNRAAERGRPGDRCALNLAGDGVARDAIARGAMIVDPWLHAPTARIDAELRVLPGEPRPVAQWLPVHLHHGTAEVPARVVLLADRAIAPGERGLVQLVLDRPIAAAAGDRFVIRDTSAQRTIGGGSFLDLRAPTRRRRTPERLAQLAAHAAPDPAAALDALLTRAPYHLDLDAFARDRGLRAEALAAAAGDVVTIATRAARIALTRATAERLERAILATLEAFHAENPDLAGIGMERLRGGHRSAPALARLRGAAAGRGPRRPRRARRRLGPPCRPRGPPRPRRRGALGRHRPAPRRRRPASGRRGSATSPASSTCPRRRSAGSASSSPAWASCTRSPTTTSSCATPSARWSASRRTSTPPSASSAPRSSATGCRTAARSRSRSSSSLTATASPCDAGTCAGSTRGGSISSAATTPRRRLREENRPRWGVRTSNPGGAVRRSLVGSTPTLFRHGQRSTA